MSNRSTTPVQTLRLASATLAVVSLTGCASFSSPSTWFGQSSPAETGSLSTSVSNAGSGITSQLKSVGSTVTSAVGKAKDAMVATFSAKPGEAVDPETSLANMPKKLSPELWVTQGHAAELKGNFSSALDFYTKALEVEPNNVAALLSTARLHVRQEQYPTAIEFYGRAINVGPTADLFAELADAQQKAGKLTEAQASIQKAIDMEPGVPRYRNNLAGMLVAVGRSDEAVRQLQQIFPPAVANYNVAYLHFTNKNFPAAQQHLQVALSADPNLQPARDLMNMLAQSQPGQASMAAYNAAQQVLRTAQGSVASSVQATQVPYATQQAAPVVSSPYATYSPPTTQAQGAYQVGPNYTQQPAYQPMTPPAFPSVPQ